MALEEKWIEHLSKEICTWSEYLATFRSRIAFSVLVGPFVVLGSLLLATKGVLSLNRPSIVTIGSIVVASLSYLGLGLYGAYLDRHITEQCDKWRRQIDRLAGGSHIDIEQVCFPHNSLLAYMWGLSLTLAAFLCVAIAIGSLFAVPSAPTP